MPARPFRERPQRARRPFWKRLAWFLLLYAGGVGVTAFVAYGLKWWIES